jgi:hypothetical protein
MAAITSSRLGERFRLFSVRAMIGEMETGSLMKSLMFFVKIDCV